MTRAESNAFYSGVLSALAVVYMQGEEAIAEEIVSCCGPYGLLRVAKKEDDMVLNDLRKTIRFLESKRRN